MKIGRTPIVIVGLVLTLTAIPSAGWADGHTPINELVVLVNLVNDLYQIDAADGLTEEGMLMMADAACQLSRKLPNVGRMWELAGQIKCDNKQISQELFEFLVDKDLEAMQERLELSPEVVDVVRGSLYATWEYSGTMTAEK